MRKSKILQSVTRPSLLIAGLFFMVSLQVSAIGDRQETAVTGWHSDGKDDVKNELSIGNDYYSFTFEGDSGALSRIRNNVTGKSYLQDRLSPDNLFRITCERKTITPEDFELKDYEFIEQRQAKLLKLYLEKDSIDIELAVRVPKDKDWSVWSLKVTNRKNKEIETEVIFPWFYGVKVTENDRMAIPSGIGKVTSMSSWRGIYGRQLSMQWYAQFSSFLNEGFGVIVQDKKALPKVMETSRIPMFSLSHFPRTLKPGESWVLPNVRILIYKGDWHRVADEYKKWYLSNFTITKSPKWFREGRWTSASVIEKSIKGVQDFKDLILVWDDAMLTGCKIIELYCWQGVEKARIYNGGDYLPAKGYGGTRALREGIRRVHARGGKVIIYVESLLAWIHSELAKSGRCREWSLMSKDGTYSTWYKGRWHMCSACEEWQDYLVNKCAWLVKELDVDGVRLDSLGCCPVSFCYNPSHKHYPQHNVWNAGVRQLLKKVRNAMAKVKKDTVLITEGFIDFYAPWVDGAIPYYYFGEESIMDYFPEFMLHARPRFKKSIPTKEEINSFEVSRYALGHPWSIYRTEDVPDEIRNIVKHWQWAKNLFKDAFVYGQLLSEKPLSSKSGFKGATYKAENYYVVTGTRGGEEGPSRLTIKGIYEKFDEALLLDIEAFEFFSVALRRDNSDYVVNIPCNTFILLLPLKACPPILKVSAIPELLPGDELKVPLYLIGQKSKKTKIKVKLSAPGLVINGKRTPVSISVPGSFQLSVPVTETRGGCYILKSLENKKLLSNETIVKVKPALESKWLFATFQKGEGAILKLTLKNNEPKKKEVILKLTKPTSWKLLPQKVSLEPKEKKVVVLKPRIAKIPKGEIGIEIAIEYDNIVDRIGHNFARRWSGGKVGDQENPSIEWDLLGRENQCLNDWLLCGPFPNPQKKQGVLEGMRLYKDWPGNGLLVDYLTEHGGETGISPKKGMKHKSDALESGQVAWTPYTLKPHSLPVLNKGEVDWNEYISNWKVSLSANIENSAGKTAYAACYIDSNRIRDTVIGLKTAAGTRLWLNHQLIFTKCRTYDLAETFTHRIPIRLKKGKNLLLIKIVNKKGFYWEPGVKQYGYGTEGSDALLFTAWVE